MRSFRFALLRVRMTMIVLCLLPLPALAFDPCAEADRAAYAPLNERYETGLLFRVERCGGTPSYLFGTIHADAPAIWEAAAPARKIATQVDSAGFEYIPPANAAQLSAQYMYLPLEDRRGLREIIGTELYGQLVTELTHRKLATAPIIHKFKPWAAAVLLQMPTPTRDGVILDSRLQQLAEQAGAQTYGLETMEEQLTLFDGMPVKQQISMLVEALSGLKEIDRINAALQADYLRGDLKAIERLGHESLKSTEDDVLRSFFAEDLLVTRNIAMAERMQTRLKAGNTLIAVGALHLPGAQGILALLEQSGYFVFVEG